MKDSTIEEIMEASKLLRGKKWKKKGFLMDNPPLPHQGD